MDLATARAEGEKPSSPMASHQGALVVAKLDGRVKNRRECVETIHRHSVTAVVLLLLLGGAPTVVGAGVRVVVAQERMVAATRRE